MSIDARAALFLIWFSLLALAIRLLGHTVWPSALWSLALTGTALAAVRVALRDRRAALPARLAPAWVLPIAALGHLLLHIGELGYHGGPLSRPQLCLLIGGALFYLACLHGLGGRLRRPHWLVGTLLLGIAVRCLSYGHFPIDPRDSDQVPLVLESLRRYASGANPYFIYLFPWKLPLVYLPLTWLAYWPAFRLGIDIRATNLILDLALGALIALSVRVPPESTGGRLRHWLRAALHSDALALFAIVFASSTATIWSLFMVHTVFWLFMSATLLCELRGYFTLSAIALGLTGAASPLAIVFAPLIGLRWLTTVGLLRATALAGLSAAIALCVIAPFALPDPEMFILCVFKWHNIYENHFYEFYKYLHGQPGLGWAPVATYFGLHHHLKSVQAVLYVAMGAFFVRRGIRAGELPLVCAAMVVVFVALNPLLATHYWMAPGIPLMLGLARAGSPASDSAARPSLA